MRILLLIFLCYGSSGLAMTQYFKYSPNHPLHIQVSNKYNHLSLGRTMLNECVGDLNFFKILTINSSFSEFLVTNGKKFNISFVGSNGLVQDAVIEAKNIPPQRIIIDMRDSSEEIYITNNIDTKIRSYIKYMRAEGKGHFGSREKRYPILIKYGQEYRFLDPKTSKGYIGHVIKIKNISKKMIFPKDYFPDVVGWYSEKIELEAREWTKIYMVRKKNDK